MGDGIGMGRLGKRWEGKGGNGRWDWDGKARMVR